MNIRFVPCFVVVLVATVTAVASAEDKKPVKVFLPTVVVSGSLHVYVSQTDRGELVFGASVAGSEWDWGTLKFATTRGQRRSAYMLVLFGAVALALTGVFGSGAVFVAALAYCLAWLTTAGGKACVDFAVRHNLQLSDHIELPDDISVGLGQLVVGSVRDAHVACLIEVRPVIAVTLTVTDVHGLVDTCDAVVTVVDLIPPSFLLCRQPGIERSLWFFQ